MSGCIFLCYYIICLCYVHAFLTKDGAMYCLFGYCALFSFVLHILCTIVYFCRGGVFFANFFSRNFICLENYYKNEKFFSCL